ncbi:MAG TPA: tetratricopeptide repeat protein [Candidatus Ozemobacteraceae bacterium]|nr:tetratricopeptide repeat protein [Candidatus Ozemobacteraceae bacterium]
MRIAAGSSVACATRAVGLALLLAALVTAGCGKKTANGTETGDPGRETAGAASDVARIASGAAVTAAGAGQNGTASGAGGILPGTGTGRRNAMNPAMRREFERRYEKGIELLEKQDYAEASRIFEQLLNESADPQDASVAEYCLAEIYFRNKSNQRALEVFRRIVEKYPGTPAADNAKAGIEYLENFQKHEAEYVSPEVEDRKRRGLGR